MNETSNFAETMVRSVLVWSDHWVHTGVVLGVLAELLLGDKEHLWIDNVKLPLVE